MLEPRRTSLSSSFFFFVCCCCGFSSQESHISDVIESVVAKKVEISDVFVDLFTTTTNHWTSMNISRPWQKHVEIFEDFARTLSSDKSFFLSSSPSVGPRKFCSFHLSFIHFSNFSLLSFFRKYFIASTSIRVQLKMFLP